MSAQTWLHARAHHDEQYREQQAEGEPGDGDVEQVSAALDDASQRYLVPTQREKGPDLTDPADAWVMKLDADGDILSGAEGWLVPGSRVNHEQSSPPLIEVQVYHFSAAQAVVFTSFDGNRDEEQDKDQNGNANVVVFASCFINSLKSP